MYQTCAGPEPCPTIPAAGIEVFTWTRPRARVFPLFTARGERKWAPGWDPTPLSGGEQRGSAFRTSSQEGRTTTWIVVDYRPSEGRVSYARLAEGSNIGLVDVVCTEPAAGGTDVSVTYTLTPLGAEGEAFVRHFLEPDTFARMIEEWRAATGAALAIMAGLTQA